MNVTGSFLVAAELANVDKTIKEKTVADCYHVEWNYVNGKAMNLAIFKTLNEAYWFSLHYDDAMVIPARSC